MVTLNISLPESINAWVLAQAEAHGFTDVSDYLSRLLASEKECQEALEQAIAEGEENGESPYGVEEIFNRVMDRYCRDRGEDVEAIAAALEEGEKNGESPYTADEIFERVLARKKRG